MPLEPDAQARDLHAFRAQLLGGREHRRMLDGAGDDVLARGGGRRAVRPRMARLSASVPPLVKTISAADGVDEGGHLAARRFQPLLRALSEMVDAGRVTIHLSEARHHRLENFRSDGSGGVVIEVEMLHLYHTFILHNDATDSYPDHRFRPRRPLRGHDERRDSGHLPGRRRSWTSATR